jgi:Domain of unknown function (DUF5615)
MLPLAADEDVHGDIVRGLRRRVPNVNLLTAQEAGLQGRPDPVVLEWAAAEGRVLVTQDRRTMVGHALTRVGAGLPMPGVLVRRKRTTIRQIIDALELVACCGIPEDFRDQVQFLPL